MKRFVRIASEKEEFALDRTMQSLEKEMKNAEFALGDEPSEVNFAWLKDVQSRLDKRRAELMNFQHTSIPHEGKRLRAFKIDCAYCSTPSAVHMNTMRGMDDEQEQRLIRRKFEEKGWKVSGSKPLCPSCFSKVRNAQKAKLKVVKETPMSVVAPIQSVERVLGVDEAILISEKLREVYIDAKAGYQDGWTDGRVARDLDIPRSWVVEVRRKQFGGGSGDSEEVREAVQEAKALLGQVKEAGECVKSAVESLSRLLTKADKIEKTVIEIEQSIR